MTNRVTSHLCAILLAFVCWVIPGMGAVVLPELQTKTETYENVTVVNQTATHLFIQHSRGVANVKIDQLSPVALASVGLGDSSHVVGSTNAAASVNAEEQVRRTALANARSSALSVWWDFLTLMFEGIKDSVPESVAARIGVVIVVTLALLLFLYLFYSYCVMLICVKAGYAPGVLAWLPILRDYALFRASGMSIAWLVLLMSPAVVSQLVQGRFEGWENVVWVSCLVALMAHCYWCVRICQARGKGMVAMASLIFPLTYPLAFLYLAFADERPAREEISLRRAA